MMVRETILQDVRGALKAALGLSDAQVIVAPDNAGPRPPLPYLTVRVLADDRLGEVEDVRVQATSFGEATREASVSVQGFGEEARDWLKRFELRLHRDLTEHCSLRASGQVLDLSAWLDTAAEIRSELPLVATYRLTDTEPLTLIELDTAEAVVELGGVA